MSSARSVVEILETTGGDGPVVAAFTLAAACAKAGLLWSQTLEDGGGVLVSSV